MDAEAASQDLNSLDAARKAIKETLKDSILEILLKNSNITRKQFETFIIDSLSGDFLKSKSKERPKLRTDKELITRGSFDRTLAQARRNITKAISTVLLLGYIGLLENPQLEPFIEVGERLRAYYELVRKSSTGIVGTEVDTLSDELRETLTSFIKRRSIKNIKKELNYF
ncbi:MAG: hypothetical protein ACUVTM_08555 [Candidatus Bathyarchaeia archaeon]